MIADIKDIKRQPGSKKNCRFDADLKFDEKGFSCTAPASVDAELTNTGKSVLIRATVRSSVKMDCCRCLAEFDLPLEVHFEEEFLPEEEAEKTKKLDYDQLSVFYYKDDRINLGEVVKQNFLAAVPYLPVCSAQCRGLCGYCGCNLNEEDCGCGEEAPGALKIREALKDSQDK